MHVKNTQIKRKFREILSEWTDRKENQFDSIKGILGKDKRINTKEERNIIAGLLTKRLKPKK